MRGWSGGGLACDEDRMARAQGETTRMLAFLFLFMIIIRGRELNSKKVRMRVELRAYMKGQERKGGAGVAVFTATFAKTGSA